MSPFHQVVEFNQQILGLQQRPLGWPAGNEIDHALKCLEEERVELSNAFQAGDFIGLVDANIVTIYFAIGNLYKLGLTPDKMVEVFTVVHNKNMEKMPGVVASRATVGAVDAIKPPGWVGPEEEIGVILDGVPVPLFRSSEPVGEKSDVIDNPENFPVKQDGGKTMANTGEVESEVVVQPAVPVLVFPEASEK